MPPKKKEVEEHPKPVVSPFLAEIQNAAQQAAEAEQIAVDIMQEVYERASQQMTSNYFDRTALPYTIQSVSMDILHLIQFVFVGRDCGDQTIDDAEAWAPSEEPHSVPADSWARGAVPTRRRPTEEEKPTTTGKLSRGSSLLKPRSRPSSALSSKPDTAAASPKAASPKLAVNKPSSPITPHVGKKKPAVAQVAVPTPTPSELKPSAAYIKEMELKKEEEAAEREKIEKMTADLKKVGKDFTVDSLVGKVIRIHHPDPKRLPNRTLPLDVTIEGEEADVVEQPVTPKKRSMWAMQKKKGKKKEPKIPPGAWLQPEDSAAPMVEEVKPAAGVILREGDLTRRVDLAKVPGKPTKHDFKRAVEALELSMEYSLAQENMSSQLQQKPSTADAADEGRTKKAADVEKSKAFSTKGFIPQNVSQLPFNHLKAKEMRPLRTVPRDRAVMYKPGDVAAMRSMHSPVPFGDQVTMGMSHQHSRLYADANLTQQFLSTILER